MQNKSSEPNRPNLRGAFWLLLDVCIQEITKGRI